MDFKAQSGAEVLLAVEATEIDPAASHLHQI